MAIYVPQELYLDSVTRQENAVLKKFYEDLAAGVTSVLWSHINFTGSSLADITTRSASALNAGTVPLAQLSGITTTQIAALAGITYAQLNLAGSILNADINASAAIAYSKLAAMTDARLLGRSAGSAGTPGEITVGTGLTLSAGTLSATGGGQVTLLKSNSGTDVSAGATNVDTVAISGLTAKDSLLIYANMTSVTQPTTTPGELYSITDSLLLANPNVAAPANAIWACEYVARQMQSGPTSIMVHTQAAENGGGTSSNHISAPTLTTNWTASWTLALRHGGVTAGGTLQWAWAVYKVAGQ